MKPDDTTPPLWRIDRTLWPAILVLAASFFLFEYTGIDLWVQDHFYDFAQREWIVDGNAALPRLLFYNAPKVLIIIIGLGVLALALFPQRWRARLPFAAVPRKYLWAVFLTLGTVPALIGQLKAVTNIFCPSEIRRYGGDVPYVRVVESYPANDRPERCGRCFPAGHASGGFALVGLMALALTRRGQRRALALAMAVGWTMGLYQMMKGAHYLSHTVITMLLAWILFLIWRRIFRLHRPPA